MTEIITQDDELISLLKDGDERILPSSKVLAKHEVSSVVEQNVPSEKPTEGSSEEQVMTEVETNLRVVIEYGTNAVQELADLASSGDHPRPYESLSTLIKSVTDANMALLSVRKKDKKSASGDGRFEKPEVDENEKTVMASVADLLREINPRNGDGDVIDVDYEEN